MPNYDQRLTLICPLGWNKCESLHRSQTAASAACSQLEPLAENLQGTSSGKHSLAIQNRPLLMWTLKSNQCRNVLTLRNMIKRSQNPVNVSQHTHWTLLNQVPESCMAHKGNNDFFKEAKSFITAAKSYKTVSNLFKKIGHRLNIWSDVTYILFGVIQAHDALPRLWFVLGVFPQFAEFAASKTKQKLIWSFNGP